MMLPTELAHSLARAISRRESPFPIDRAETDAVGGDQSHRATCPGHVGQGSEAVTSWFQAELLKVKEILFPTRNPFESSQALARDNGNHTPVELGDKSTFPYGLNVWADQ